MFICYSHCEYFLNEKMLLTSGSGLVLVQEKSGEKRKKEKEKEKKEKEIMKFILFICYLCFS